MRRDVHSRWVGGKEEEGLVGRHPDPDLQSDDRDGHIAYNAHTENWPVLQETAERMCELVNM